jgi:hypothetical protein
LSVGEAHAVLKPREISGIFRGVLVVTRESGGSRRTYPTRSIWPALIAITANRPFAIVDDEGHALEDPRDPSGLPNLVADLSVKGGAFESRFLRMLGREDLVSRPVTEFSGFPLNLGRREAARPEGAPITASNSDPTGLGDPRFVIHVGGRHPEYLVVTGEDWFFKASAPTGSSCIFHEWPRARIHGVSAPQPISGRSEGSYTESGDIIHCAHEELRAFRSARCKIDALESHLCCRACIFSRVCWSADAERLPCPA